ncbi:hypothetical protein AXF42_Ash003196 [Apostasia shenzhenica]|uniref:Uncharacterized protein n=1 Tax=Apostasia shenzhenica TaxID=1088818 RepID=A0A2I0BFK0_9ASPA|nr:hypothetical protein AXF42_Ash003196 [Apostasia shenzhenica]
MSLRHMSRIVFESGARFVQGAREQASRSIKDAASGGGGGAGGGGSASSSSARGRRLSSTANSSRNIKAAVTTGEDKRRKAEEALRTVIDDLLQARLGVVNRVNIGDAQNH